MEEDFADKVMDAALISAAQRVDKSVPQLFRRCCLCHLWQRFGQLLLGTEQILEFIYVKLF
jgi:hypothetical protein